jgi:soluble lytic murein transglycosylase
MDNGWLEVYRLYVRIQAFGGSGDSTGAAGRAVSALRLIRNGGAAGHHLEGVLVDMAAEYGGIELALPYMNSEIISVLAPSTLIGAASTMIRRGDTEKADLYLTLAAAGGPGAEDLSLIGELSQKGLSPGTFEALSAAALVEDLPDLAGDLADSAGSVWITSILKADIMASSGRKSKALKRLRDVFEDQDCPIEEKKKALSRIASLQYSMKRYRDASRSWRIFGEAFPDDPGAEMLTDRSARISVSAGRWTEAIGTWKRIADSGPKTYSGRESLLGMAVVLDRLGRNEEAFGILYDNLEGVTGRLRAAYLYWIIRTCSDSEKKRDLRFILEGEAAYSFYAKAIEEGDGFLLATGNRKDAEVTGLERTTRTSLPPRESTQACHEAFDAFRYFAGEGLREEATGCARDYLELRGCVTDIYGEAREAGIEDLCLEIAASCPEIFGERYLEYLYPFAYGREIDREASRYAIPAEMVLAVIREESRFGETALSPAGAHGLMQIMPSTGEWIGPKIGWKNVAVEDLQDPDFNISAGCWYLRFLLDRADDSIVAALASYNAGHGRMKKWKKNFRPRSDPLAALELIGPNETRRYVRRVLDTMSAYSRQATDSFQ